MRLQLEDQRQKYRHMFDAAPDAWLVTLAHTEIVEANRAAAELLNITRDTLRWMIRRASDPMRSDAVLQG